MLGALYVPTTQHRWFDTTSTLEVAHGICSLGGSISGGAAAVQDTRVFQAVHRIRELRGLCIVVTQCSRPAFGRVDIDWKGWDARQASPHKARVSVGAQRADERGILSPAQISHSIGVLTRLLLLSG